MIFKEKTKLLFEKNKNPNFQKLEEYVGLVLEYNQKFNLTGFDNNNIWEKGIYNSIIFLKKIFEKNTDIENIGDVGSGSGLPSIPFLIYCNKKIDLTIIEPLKKRASFLIVVKKELNLNFFIINKRAEIIKDKKFDLVCARAVAPLKILLEITTALGMKGSSFAFIKGPKVYDEVKESNFIINELKINYKIIRMDEIKEEEQNIFFYKKNFENSKYPRNWNKIIKS